MLRRVAILVILSGCTGTINQTGSGQGGPGGSTVDGGAGGADSGLPGTPSPDSGTPGTPATDVPLAPAAGDSSGVKLDSED